MECIEPEYGRIYHFDDESAWYFLEWEGIVYAPNSLCYGADHSLDLTNMLVVRACVQVDFIVGKGVLETLELSIHQDGFNEETTKCVYLAHS